MEHKYDDIAYPAFAHFSTHPDRIAVMGALHGLTCTPVHKCRVLYVGCNDGANLIPMAYGLPETEFVGFDLAALPIAEAQRKIEKLALNNIRVFQADLTQVDASIGTFDYVIAHGIYSWVSARVRDSLLQLCRNHLNPNGIAFVSYNALPGGRIREMMRDVLVSRIEASGDPLIGLGEGLQVLDSIAECRPENDLLGVLARQEAGKIRERTPELVYHDEASPTHHAVSFTEFMKHATQHGLRFVAEASVPPLDDASNHPGAVALAKRLGKGDHLAEEQVLDFVRMRAYRETLLCRGELKPTAEIDVAAIGEMRLASQAMERPTENSGTRAYMGPTGFSMETSETLITVALEYLVELWPQSASWDALVSHLEDRKAGTKDDLLRVAERLLSARLLELRTNEPPVSDGREERPRASAISRFEASEQNIVSTLLHYPIKLNDALVKQLLLLLDGTRDRAELARALHMKSPDLPKGAFADGVEASLQMLQRGGVLERQGFRS